MLSVLYFTMNEYGRKNVSVAGDIILTLLKTGPICRPGDSD